MAELRELKLIELDGEFPEDYRLGRVRRRTTAD
jgi:hypothetical protein